MRVSLRQAARRFAAFALLAAALPAFAASPSTTTLAITSGGTAVTSVPAGAVVTLTATVVSGATSVMPGTVFFCSSANCHNGSLLGQAQITSAGTAVTSFQLGAGSYSIYARFAGTTTYTGSSSATTSLTVTAPAAGYPVAAATLTSTGSGGNYTLNGTLYGIVGPAIDGALSFTDTTSGQQLGSASFGPSVFATAPQTTIAGPGGATFLVRGDFNNDGFLDYVVLGPSSAQACVNNGAGAFTCSSLDAEGSNGFAVGDFNNDGKLDLATSYSAGEVIEVFLNTSAPGGAISFSRGPNFNVPNGDFSEGLAVGDFNGDGNLDLAVAASPGILYYPGTGSGTFGSVVNTGASANTYYGIVAADLNNDGLTDLAAFNTPSSQSYTVLLNSASSPGSFTATNYSTGLPVSSIAQTSLYASDLQNNGVLDLVATAGNAVQVIIPASPGVFTNPAVNYPVAGLTSATQTLAIADFSGDGNLDVAAPSSSAGISLLLGKGDGTLGTQTVYPSRVNAQGLVAGNFRGTGSNDIASVYVSGGTSTVGTLQPGMAATATLSGVAPNGPGVQTVSATHAAGVYAAATTNSVALNGGTIVTSTNLSASPAGTSAAGASVTLTATIAPLTSNGFSATGSIAFYNGATVLNTQTVTSTTSTYTYAATLPAGRQTLTAVYSGDTNFITSTSPAVGYSSTSTSSQLVFLNTPPAINAGGNAGILRIAEEDSNGNIAPTSGNTTTLTVTSGAPAYSQTYTATTSNGIATFDLSRASLLTAGNATSTYTYTPSATRNGNALTATAATETVTSATVYTVTSSADTSGACTNQNAAGATLDATCTLRQAITTGNAAAGGTVNFAPALFGSNYGTPATIRLTSSFPNLSTSFNFSGPGPALLTLSGGNTPGTIPGNSVAYAMFKDLASSAQTIAISGLTIANVYSSSTFPALSVTTASQTISVNNVAFVSNRGLSGGAVYLGSNFNQTATFNNCTFTGNYASNGGAIDYAAGGGAVTVSNSYFAGNTTTGSGGAVYYVGGVTRLTLTNDTFYNNTAVNSGGAIYATGQTLIVNSTVVGNTATSTTNVNTTGGLYHVTSNGNLTLYNSVVVANTAGTGVADFNSTSNTSTNANNITSTGSVSPYTLATLGLGAPSVVTSTGQYSYGGPTAILPLLPGSPLLGAGAASNPGTPTTDQRGFARPTSGAVDIGAEQSNLALAFSQQPPTTANINTPITPAPAVQLFETGYLLNAAVPVSIALSPGSFTSGSTTTVSTSAGTATFPNLSPFTAGNSVVLSASTGTSPNLYAVSSNPFTIYPGPSAQLGFGTAPATPITDGGNAGSAVTVLVEDGNGNTVTSSAASVTLTVTYPNATTQTYTASALNGIATFNLSAVPLASPGTYTYTATSTGLTQAQATETVNAGPVSSFVVSGFPAASPTGKAQTITVTAYDQAGNVATNFTGTVTLTSSDTLATFSPASYTYTASDNGAHAFTVALGTAGKQTLVATSGSVMSIDNVVTSGYPTVLNNNGTITKLFGDGTTAGSFSGAGSTGLARDFAGDLWSLNATGNALIELSRTGVALGSFTGGGLNAPGKLAIDGLGQVWITNGNGSLSQFSNTGTAITPATGYTASGTLSTPAAISVDSAGSLWIADPNGAVEVIGIAAPVATPNVTQTINANPGTRP